MWSIFRLVNKILDGGGRCSLKKNLVLDEQKCELRFGSTGFSASQVRFGLFVSI